MKKYGSLFLIVLLLMAITACNNEKRALRTDTLTSGVASIGIDDCFGPIVNEEIAVFQGLNDEASINPVYGDEVSVIKLLLQDSLRLVVAARDLTSDEKEIIKQNNLQPRSQKIAVDGLALIVNKSNNDTLINLSTLKKIMTGDITSWKQLNPNSSLSDITVVFDNQNSSTVRFIKDSINSGQAIAGKSLNALKTNKEVIDYVSKTPNAMGVIGVNWISNPNDTTNNSFIKDIRVMSVSKSENATVQNSYKPYPAFLALGNYPLTRDVYIILSDLRDTLPAGFVNFVGGDSGQRIIVKAGLLPATRPMRVVSIQDSF